MRRRQVLALLGGAAAWPLAAHGQEPRLPLIAFLSSRSRRDSEPHTEGFLRGLKALGYVDGKNTKIEYRWANGRYEMLPELAAELVRLGPAVIAAGGGAPSARAAMSATPSIPIVFVTSGSVEEQLVTSLNRPGANVSGVDLMSGDLTGKRLQLLELLLPAGAAVCFLNNPKGIEPALRIKEAERAAQTTGRRLLVVGASTDAEMDASIAKMAENKIAGLVVQNDPFFDARRERLIQLTARWSIPAIYHIREFPADGGLMSYGASLVDAYNLMGVQVGRVLQGANVEELPVVRPTKFELVINLKTAQALGLTVPTTLFGQADEVIE
jgi:putative tryptophan/tyrosine transport system substrate-binding protein